MLAIGLGIGGLFVAAQRNWRGIGFALCGLGVGLTALLLSVTFMLVVAVANRIR